MKNILLLIFLASFVCVFAQSEDEIKVKSIYDEALARGKSYSMLEYLTTKIGPRLSGSTGATNAVEWTKNEMKKFADSVWLQPVMVPHWIRGNKEGAKIINVKNKNVAAKKGAIEVNVCALGMSVGTGPKGVQAGIVEVKSFDELRQLGADKVQGKIIFFNRPMDPTRIQTFAAYGGAVDQRAGGASEAAKLGAIGVVVRSMGSTLEDYPHTGGLRYAPNVAKIPAVAIATRHAELLSALLKEEKDLQFYFQSNCETLADAPSFNVIGELKGTELSDEYIVVGGHLDSWDLAQGAHDDGSGCVQSMEVLRILKAIGYKPKRTIRAVMFMNEENGLRGGQEYAKQAEMKKEKHLAAIESDRGGFTPRGFTMAATDSAKAKVRDWKPILEQYGLTDFNQSGGGADIGPLANQGVALFGYLPDSQRYFSYHHTREDTFDKVNQRELELGAASMAALVYLLDKYGLK
jgi:carboxypeptidase Q